jgi:hypothetical protein
MATVIHQSEKHMANTNRAIDLVSYIYANLHDELHRQWDDIGVELSNAEVAVLVPSVLEAMRMEMEVRKENTLDEQIGGLATIFVDLVDSIGNNTTELAEVAGHIKDVATNVTDLDMTLDNALSSIKNAMG